MLSRNILRQLYRLLLYCVTSFFPWTRINVNLMNFDIFIVSVTWNAFCKIVFTNCGRIL